MAASLPPALDKPRQRGRPKLRPDDAQRSLIADCARQLFLQKGYGRTTTDEVAARCRISKHTLYRLFPGKPALFAAIVDLHRQAMLALPGDYDGLPLDRALEAIFRIDIDPQADKDRVALLRLVMLEAHQSPELGEIVRRHGADKSRTELAGWLAAQASRGAIAIDDPHSAARILMDMIFGAIAFKTVDNLNWPGDDDRNAHIRRCIAVFLNGVRPR
ncbi:MAG TPA: TetR/AcrR family transcriptional regulator [Rhodopseudomonas sp.]|uniref:TetR/AcrR family transcriptional regulator n=1 Tax=Rhodopseudomonas sp. TaxID=1078 RepID=UPI002ED8CB4B